METSYEERKNQKYLKTVCTLLDIFWYGCRRNHFWEYIKLERRI